MIAGLPYDAEVEYLQSTGAQYIDTGVSACNAVVGTDIRFQSTSTQNNEWVFGTYSGSLGNNYNYLVGSLSGWCVGLYDNTFYRPGTPVDTGVHRVRINIDGKTRFDDVVLLDGTASKTYEGDRNTSLWMFMTHRTGSNPMNGYYLTAKVFYCKVYLDGVLVRDFIPVRFTNELGQSEGAMYDRVSRKLFRNAGTGALTIGPDVATPVMGLHFMPKPPPYDAEVDYLESTGTQYIDTGLWFTEDTQLECVMSEGSDLSSLSTGGGGSVTGSSINGYGQQWRYAGYSKNANGNFYWDGSGLCDGSFVTCTMDSSRKVYRNGSYLFDACVEGYHNFENRYTRMYIMAQLVGDVINPRLYRVRSFKVVRSGTTIIDAKAVRFTNEQGVSEGAMYDNVSKQLFRNQGTGAFLWAEKQ